MDFIAIWPGGVEDDLEWRVLGRVCFGVHGGEGAEELVGDVGEDGGAAGGDAVLREQDEKIGEDLIDVGGGFELRELAGESGGEVGVVALLLVGERVFAAETGERIEDGAAATAAGGSALLTAGGSVFLCDRPDFIGVNAAVDDGARGSGFVFHFVPRGKSGG